MSDATFGNGNGLDQQVTTILLGTLSLFWISPHFSLDLTNCALRLSESKNNSSDAYLTQNHRYISSTTRTISTFSRLLLAQAFTLIAPCFIFGYLRVHMSAKLKHKLKIFLNKFYVRPISASVLWSKNVQQGQTDNGGNNNEMWPRINKHRHSPVSE